MENKTKQPLCGVTLRSIENIDFPVIHNRRKDAAETNTYKKKDAAQSIMPLRFLFTFANFL